MALDLLLSGGTLLDARTGDARRADILIRDGKIAAVGDDLGDAPEAAGAPVYDASGKTVSQGWMDMHVHFREPGQEHKETIETGARAAAFGGFTAVACMPNTEPPIATRDVVEFVRKRAEGLAVDVYPIGTVSKGRKGEELAEIIPLGDQILVEARVKPEDIANVQPGQQATVKLSAYDYTIYGSLKGTVDLISADTFKDDRVRDGDPHYRVILSLDLSGLTDRQRSLEIRPGMVADVELHTGSKTILHYLMKPLYKSREAFREP